MGNNDSIKQSGIEESGIIRFLYEDPSLSWEIRSSKTVETGSEAEEVYYYLKIDIPVDGYGYIHQSFKLDRVAIEKIVNWMAGAIGWKVIPENIPGR